MSSSVDPTDLPDQTTGPERTTTHAAPVGAVSSRRFGLDRQSVVAREKEVFGGLKIGSAFFGWLTATGTAVLLTAVLAAAGAAIGIATDTDLDDAAAAANEDPQTIGIAGGIALLVVLLIAYYCGGYVAGRMSRFNGALQGFGVWLWAIVIAAVVAVVAAVAGDDYNVLAELNSFPRFGLSEGELTNGGIIALVAVVVVALIGALLGGLAGMRYHRKVDRAGLGA